MNDRAFWLGNSVLRKSSSRANGSAEDAAGVENNRMKIIQLLNGALAIARAGALRAEQQYCAAYRSHSPGLAAAALEHANGTWMHAQRIARRIAELGGESEGTYSAEDAPSAQAPSLIAMISDDLLAQRATIRSYRRIAAYCSNLDPVSQKMIEAIVADEETSAGELAQLLQQPAPAAR